MTTSSFKFSSQLKTGLSVCIFIGFFTFISGVLFADTKRVWFAFLVSSLFVLFLSLGGVFFTAIQYVSKAGWSVNIRRIMESMGAYIPYGCFFMFVLFVFGDSIYMWLDPQIVEKDSLLVHKASYLNFPFLMARLVAFSGIWIVLSYLLRRNSLLQDKTGEESLTHKNTKLSVAFIGLFSLSFTFFTIDSLMALEPHWFSTVFGVYSFTGLFQSSIAALILFTIYFMKKGYLKGLVDENHLHDLGKFLFGCTILWAYIAFSQYMLVWYTNLPEEAVYYYHRSQNQWMWVSISLIVFKFIVPFLFLLPRWVKREQGSLILASSLILIMQYVDIYWMVYPNYHLEKVTFGFLEVGLLIGFIGLFLLPIFYFLSKHPLVPQKDPRAHESKEHVVTY